MTFRDPTITPKLCPFCQQEPEAAHFHAMSDQWMTRCVNASCTLFGQMFTLEHWNRRPSPRAPSGWPTREQIEALGRWTCDLEEDDTLAGPYAYMDAEREGEYIKRAEVLALFAKSAAVWRSAQQ